MNDLKGSKEKSFQLAARRDAILGCLLGTAVGDALGLPMEGLSRPRQYRIYPEINAFHFLFGKGMVSDDTEHTCMVAQAIVASGGDEVLFAKELAWRMRRWLLGLPAAIGYSTLRAVLKLWLGFSSERSGVFSAGNGPAMRSAIIGVCFGEERGRLKNLVRVSTRITHTDPRAEYGSLAVALAAAMASRDEDDPGEYIHILEQDLGEGAGELIGLAKEAAKSAASGRTTAAFASELGLGRGVTGYMYHTVPVVLHAWFRHPRDYLTAVIEAIRCGGDTDTVGSILGGIVGAAVGKGGIPQELITHLCAWPITPAWMERVGEELAHVAEGGKAREAPHVPLWGVLAKNLVFLVVVLMHGFRRLLPPY